MSADMGGIIDETATVELPSGWRAEHAGPRSAVYAYGSHIELEINPRYHSSIAREHKTPSVYQVRLRKRRHNRVITGAATILATPSSFSEARETAQQYMEEFVAERKETAMELRPELEADPVMAEEAEEAIVTEAATHASVTIAGYSDELFVNELRSLLEPDSDFSNTVLQAVIHRDHDEYDVVYVAEDSTHLSNPRSLRTFAQQFEWLNDQKLATVINAGALTVMIARFEETRLIRYLANEAQETLVLLAPDYPLHVPPFERQFADIISEKWK